MQGFQIYLRSEIGSGVMTSCTRMSPGLMLSSHSEVSFKLTVEFRPGGAKVIGGGT